MKKYVVPLFLAACLLLTEREIPSQAVATACSFIIAQKCDNTEQIVLREKE